MKTGAPITTRTQRYTRVVVLLLLLHMGLKAQYLEDSALERTAIICSLHLKKQQLEQFRERPPVDCVEVKNGGLKDRKFRRSATELLLAELVPWTVDRYIRHVDYATISLETLKYNIKPGSWSWDGDGFITNQFGHPYHGSLFFNSFRSNGYNFWQSSIAAFTGSLVWEIAAENQAPAPNDLINTTFGGIVMGEMTHKLANRIIDNSARGLKRQASEVFAFIINPMNGLSRILDGKWGRVNSNALQRDSTAIYSEVYVGLRNFTVDSKTGNFGMYGRIKFLYGSPYKDYKDPFGTIYINVEFGQDRIAFINNVNIYGSIKGWQPLTKRNLQQLLVITANYDYIRNQSFFYSAQSVKLNLHTNLKLAKAVSLNSTISGGPILLASLPDPYLFKGRYYDYCAGVGYQAGGTLNLSKHFSAGINYRGASLKTINGHSSHFQLHAVTTEFRVLIKNGLSLGVEPGRLVVHGYYPGRRDITTIYPFLRLAAIYSFHIK